MRWALLLLALLFAAPAEAQFTPPGFPQGVFANQNARDPQPSASYVGPGDIVSGATAWYGLRGYNAAYCGSKAINVRRASDNSTQDINVLSAASGCGLDTATAATFAGTDATASCSTTGLSTTMACTGASSTPHVNDPISCSGCTQPLYAAAVGTFTAGAGTVTLSTAQNIAVAETVTFKVALFVTEAYDQTGNAHNSTQSTAANQPALILLCDNGGTVPCMVWSGSDSLIASFPAVAQPITFMMVANRTPASSAIMSVLSTFTGGNFSSVMGFNDVSNQAYLYGGASGGPIITQSATDAESHVIIGVANTSSSIISVDNSNNTGTLDASTTSTTLDIGFQSAFGPNQFIGWFDEGGMWPSGFSTTQITNECHNARSHYGTPGSC